MPSDSDLIERCLAGDSSAFDGIVLRYQDALFRHLLRLAGHREQAEDLCQEALIKFYHALPSFDRGRAVAPFLFKIATNLWRDGRGSPLMLLGDEEIGAITEPSQPEREALDQVERCAILEAMRSLRSEYREVLSLRYDQGLSYREIAEVTGVSAGTIATWLHRALDALRDALHTAEREAAR
jgi:RNA polymerase sigma-70 factor (ECF subfamily)